jgi:hypothetical protein
MNRKTLESLTGEAMKHLSELSRAADGMNAAYGCAGERLEQPPPAGTHGEPALAQVRLELAEDVVGQSLPRPLQVQYQLGVRGRGREQLVQLQSPAPRRLELPPIPENRDRPGGLQVPNLQPAPIEADVSFYKGRLEALCGAEIGEVIPGAVRHEERAQSVVADVREEWPAHRARV